ncbi:Pyrophosphate-energized vacuolar membrane proton pump [Hordeum vulgare]|nr:Pyrophosphate-energized vacuolar membrane proton pump [Hordeum vulgare]
MLGSSGAGSSRSRRPKNISFPIIGLTDCASHRERAVHRGKERIMVAKARIVEEMAAQSLDAEEAICARILKKRQRRNTRALAREQNLRGMTGLPPKMEKEVSDDEDNFGSICTASSTNTFGEGR